jgi:hypothetical protein
VNSWTKRAIGVAALAGGLLALGVGTASAEEASTRASVRIGAAPTAEVRLCGGGAVPSGLLGRCGGQAGSGSDGTTVRVGGNTVRVRMSGLGSAGGSLETRPSAPRATVSGRAAIPRHARPAADVSADDIPGTGVTAEVATPSARALDSAGPSAAAKVAIMLAREGMGDGLDATATVDLAGPAAATVDANLALGGAGAAADVNVTDPVAANADAAITVGRGDGATDGDAAVELGLGGPADAPAASADANVTVGLRRLADPAAANADADLAVGLSGLSDPAAASAAAALAVGLPGLAVPGLDGAVPALPAPVGDGSVDGLPDAVQTPGLGVGDLVPSTAGAICVGACGADTGSGGSGSGGGGTPAPTQPSPTQPAPTPPAGNGSGGQSTGTDGVIAPDGTGATGTSGRLAGSAGATGATLARLRSALGGAAGGSLAFTGARGDLLAFMALGLLMAGALLLRAARPAKVTERR